MTSLVVVTSGGVNTQNLSSAVSQYFSSIGEGCDSLIPLFTGPGSDNGIYNPGFSATSDELVFVYSGGSTSPTEPSSAETGENMALEFKACYHSVCS